MNHYIRWARAQKVQNLMKHVPAGDGKKIAAELAKFTPLMKSAFACGSGVTTPSDETWALLCEAVRGRS